jgi:hypothetical protein
VKTLICIALWFVVFITVASTVRSQTQEIEGYTFIRGQTTSSIVCLGRWVPPTDVGKPGVCEGRLVDVAELTAVSTKMTTDKLDQLLIFLSSIDQKLADNNDRLDTLIEATVNTQASIDQQVEQVGELLRDAIASRFDTLPRRILANDVFRKALEKLKADILTEVMKAYPAQQTPPAK